MERPEFEPVSELAGNIEIVLNQKLPQLDPYEPVSEQVVFSIGKTGRSGRIKYDSITSNEVQELIDALELAKESLETIEEYEKKQAEEAGGLKIDRMETGNSENLSKTDIDVLEELIVAEAYLEPIDKEEFIQNQDLEEEEVKAAFNNLMNNGKLFYPKKGKVKLNSGENRIRTVKQIIISSSGEDDSAEINEVFQKASKVEIEPNQTEKIIEKLKREGELFEPKQGFIQRI